MRLKNREPRPLLSLHFRPDKKTLAIVALGPAAIILAWFLGVAMILGAVVLIRR